jgi:hypothetical protein
VKIKQIVGKSKLRLLAINTGLNISILITYILFLTEMQKRQTPEKGFALFKNDITGFLGL